eukprot:363542-Chlamydomonas_euryale.AAC.6
MHIPAGGKAHACLRGAERRISVDSFLHTGLTEPAHCEGSCCLMVQRRETRFTAPAVPPASLSAGTEAE